MNAVVVEEQVLPVVKQPKGWRYFFGTWSGRLLLVNTAIFLWMISLSPSAFLLPEPDVLRSFGVKSLADIAMGEYWRFFSPIFIHIGFLHFLFNSMGLYYIGYQFEHMLGGRWFILLYLVSGLVGNVASCVFSAKLSAGASGAIFGLLGAGFVLEQTVSQHLDENSGVQPRRKVYAGMVIVNVLLGIFIPVIDNAAHLGGLFAGVAFIYALLCLRPNRLAKRNPRVGTLIVVGVTLLALAGIWYAANPTIVVSRFIAEAKEADSMPESWLAIQEALRVDENSPDALLWEGRLLILADQYAEGLSSVERGIRAGAAMEAVHGLANELKLLGHSEESERILSYWAQRPLI